MTGVFSFGKGDKDWVGFGIYVGKSIDRFCFCFSLLVFIIILAFSLVQDRRNDLAAQLGMI